MYSFEFITQATDILGLRELDLLFYVIFEVYHLAEVTNLNRLFPLIGENESARTFS